MSKEETTITIVERDETLPDEWELHTDAGKGWKTHKSFNSKDKALAHARGLKAKDDSSKTYVGTKYRVMQAGSMKEYLDDGSDIKDVVEDAPVNCAGDGNVAGIGVGNKGEPGVQKKKTANVVMGMLKRKLAN